ncbi:MAG: CPBP family intramembrane metalloprotease [Lachnospiraceae bacterium]|nr:CPBP family intramembrane metalloprotease [Lachnospiraceae bacterium]
MEDFFGDIPFGEMFPEEGMSQKIAVVVLQLAFSIIVFFPAFGEEWGWRGYLGPKLEEVMSKPAAILLGGVLWGLWHAPLTIAGHNFGVDYQLYPWLGIGAMCLLCICLNAFLTLLTERTKSIYPAAFAHMLINNCSAFVLMSILTTEDLYEKMQTIPAMCIFAVGIPLNVLVGGVSLGLYVYGTRNSKMVSY